MSNADQNFIAKCISGDARCWRELVDCYINIVYNAAYNTVSKYNNYVDSNDVDDICQNVFVGLLINDGRSLKRYDGSKARFSTWLTVITRNAAIDYIRKKKALTVSLEESMEAMHYTAGVEPADIEIPNGVITSRQHLVLRMMYEDGLDVVEIAFFLGVKRQTVRSLHHRALKKLREFYGLKTPGKTNLKAANNGE